ncbi:3-mercaptopyruvate sulfurtransferase [Acuticoccus sp. M5D2P5]|uniref:3-mercaptopyruvate sulfurtransferase n=1 Tax=Acuticoccus kalidii TaxID=2910977 RepID=UPI001F236A32|nr:3-mercaptopyruvate sulfurtransferase [Acuticoccus kalidii]MCF3936076.1 3-mercaptopyruvate sulfurtransferase [Acuticoccus kalidii]
MMLITANELNGCLKSTVVLDASWHMPDAGRDPQAEYEAGHIPGALRFDIDKIADTSSDLPHTLPTPEAFGKMVGALGISNDSEIVIYEQEGLFAAPRVWWMFRVMGHQAKILKGGLAAWKGAGYPLETGPGRKPFPATFTAIFQKEQFADADTVAKSLKRDANVADARGAERFFGRAPEPRPGVRAGHMPGAKNVPYTALLDAQGNIKPDEEVRKTFEAAGVDLDRPVITTCGSGVTASILALALCNVGTEAAVYDGSWTEWGSDEKRPVVTDE